MGSQTLPQIPVIDFSKEDLKPGSSSWLSMCNQVRNALEEYACFVAKYDQLSPQLCKKLLSQTKDMFELPTEIKKKNNSDEPFRGYYTGPSIHPVRLFEGMGIDNARVLEETHKFMNLLWSAGNDQFCEVVNSYAKLLGDLNEKVIEMAFESYGAEKHYASLAATNSHVLRFLKFIPQESEVGSVRFPAHKDLSFATIVQQTDVPALEVQLKDGTWIAIQPQLLHILFLACEGMQLWSNDMIKACNHRVNISGNRERYSMGLFIFNNGVIQVPKEMVDDKHPLLYNPFDHPGFLRFLINADMAIKVNNPTKAFCGVGSQKIYINLSSTN